MSGLICKRWIFVGVIIGLLFVSFFAMQISYCSDAESVALEFLENVVGIDMNSYNVISFNASGTTLLDSNHSQTNIRIVIGDGHKTFDILITLADGRVWMYRLDLLSGELEDEETGLNNCLTVAKGAINGYQRYFNAVHCGGFDKMVSTALQTNSSKVENENVILDIYCAEDSASSSEHVRLCWFEKIAGQFTIPHRSVSISISKAGMVTRFTDNLGLYQVATTNIDISKEQAIKIATSCIEEYAFENKRKVKAIEATFEYVSDITSSRGSRFLIYPQWKVLAGFDDLDRNYAYAYGVMIWADNGEIYNRGPQGSYRSMEMSTPLFSLWPFAVVIVALALLFGLVSLARHRIRVRCVKRMDINPKVVYTLIMLVFFCFLSAPQINLVMGDSSSILGSRWNLPQEEIDACNLIANYISLYSSSAGFATYNWYGSSTTASNAYRAAGGVGHSFSISFYIGHGGVDSSLHFWGWPWQWHTHSQYVMLADDSSYLYDCYIYPYSICHNVKFVYLWSCDQGDEIGSMVTYPCGEYKARGMPLAWLHTTLLSTDGYASPDTSGQAFIGFLGDGPYLTDDNTLGATDAGYCFLYAFYFTSVGEGYYYSINAALDFAANAVWGTSFGNCILHTGYWIDNFAFGRAVVYGQGNIHISNS